MALEVESQSYMYNELTASEHVQKSVDRRMAEERRDAIEALRLARRQAASAAKASTTSRSSTTAHSNIVIPFKHNPLHDLESVVWVVIWLFVCSEFVQEDPALLDADEWSRILKNHAGFATRLFRQDIFRRNAMTTSTTLLNGFDTALPQVQQHAQALNAIRDALLKCFVAVDKQRKRTGEQVSFKNIVEFEIHHTIINALEDISLALSGDDLKINVSAWAEQRNKMRDAVVMPDDTEAPVAGTRRLLDGMQDGAATSNKRYKQHEGQSASSALVLSLPVPVPSEDSQPRAGKRRL